MEFRDKLVIAGKFNGTIKAPSGDVEKYAVIGDKLKVKVVSVDENTISVKVAKYATNDVDELIENFLKQK